jgi:N-acetylmuramoyl-L-alanine amidase
MPTCAAWLWLLLSGTGLAAGVVVEHDGTEQELPTLVRGVSRYVPITMLAEKLRISWNWELPVHRLTLSAGGTALVLTQDNPFYTIDGEPRQLPCVPIRNEALLYLPASVLTQVLRPLYSDTLWWSAQTERIHVGGTLNSVDDIECSVKAENMVVTISLSDSVGYDYVYAFPNLVFRFPEVIIDAGLRPDLCAGEVVDSVTVGRYDNAAQLSFVLRRHIEEPMVEASDGGRRLLVSFRVQDSAGPVPDNALFSRPARETISTIVIDPGHGGKDPGALGPGGVREKDVVLGIGLKLRDLLKEETDFEVHMTREKDVFVPLRDRTRFANEKGADVFVSIHANSIGGSRRRRAAIKGYKVYFLSEAKNEADKLVAMTENAVVKLEESPPDLDMLQSVIIQMINNEYLNESQDLSILLAESFGNSLKKVGKLHLGVGQAPFWVLNGAYMPSVLVETAFISNPTEEKLLQQSEFQKRVAEAIMEALVQFKKKYEAGP